MPEQEDGRSGAPRARKTAAKPAARPRKRVDSPPPSPAPRLPRWAPWLEIAFAVVLSAAGLGSAWVSQQTRLWSGIQAERYAHATALRGAASRAHARADARLSIEVGLFSQWLNAKVTNRDDLADAYRRRFPPAFRPVFESWWALRPLENGNAPLTPFDMVDRQETARAARLEQEAETTFRQAQEASHSGERFGQVNVIFAAAMFLAGIGNHFKGSHVRLALMMVGLLCCAVGFVRMLQLPALLTP